jgi:hypothetical protein
MIIHRKLILHNPSYNSKNNYLIFKPNILTSFLISHSFSLLTNMNMDMKRQINMCIFTFIIFILIQIKFDIGINND